LRGTLADCSLLDGHHKLPVTSGGEYKKTTGQAHFANMSDLTAVADLMGTSVSYIKRSLLSTATDLKILSDTKRRVTKKEIEK